MAGSGRAMMAVVFAVAGVVLGGAVPLMLRDGHVGAGLFTVMLAAGTLNLARLIFTSGEEGEGVQGESPVQEVRHFLEGLSVQLRMTESRIQPGSGEMIDAGQERERLGMLADRAEELCEMLGGDA